MINWTRSASTWLMVTLLSFSTGCAVSIKENMKAMPDITHAKVIRADSASKGLVSERIVMRYPRLEAAYWQVREGDSARMKLPDNAMPSLKSAWAGPSLRNPLPTSFASDPLVKKMIITSRHALLAGDEEEQRVTKNDIVSHINLISNNFGGNKLMTKDNESNESKQNIYRLAQSYLCAYFLDEKNGFVDRDGTKYMAPEFKGKVENATITAIVGIVWEAIADDLFQTPIWITDDEKYITKGGNAPTAYKIVLAMSNRDIREKVVNLGQTGIDENKIKVMRFLSNLAGEQSKTLSGMAYKSLGKVNLQFLIGAGFSFGDNDTLAKVLDTSFEIVAKRISIESSRHLLAPITYTVGEIKPEKEESPEKREALKLLLIVDATK